MSIIIKLIKSQRQRENESSCVGKNITYRRTTVRMMLY